MPNELMLDEVQTMVTVHRWQLILYQGHEQFGEFLGIL